MRIDNVSGTNFQAKFVLRDEANLLKFCNKRFKNISKLFEEKTANSPDDKFMLLLDKCNDASFITKIKKGNYEDTICLKEGGLEALLSHSNDTIVNKLVKVFNTAQRCAKLSLDADKLIKDAKKANIENKYLDAEPVKEFLKDAILNAKSGVIKKDRYLNDFVIKGLIQ